MRFSSQHMVERAQELRANATPPEQIMWQKLRKYRPLGIAFRRQVPLLDKYVADFCCRKAKVILEIDGFWAHWERGDYDLKRKADLEAAGFTVIVCSAADVSKRSAEIAFGAAIVCADRIGIQIENPF